MGPLRRIAERWQERRQERRERRGQRPPRQALQELRQEMDQSENENENEQKKRRAEEEERQNKEGKREISYAKIGEWHLHSMHCEPNRRVTVWYETAQGGKQRYTLGKNEGERSELRGSDLSLQRHGRSFPGENEPTYDLDFVTIGAKGAFAGTEFHVQIEGLPERTIIVGKGEEAEATREESRAAQIMKVRDALREFKENPALLAKFKNENKGRDPVPLLETALKAADDLNQLRQALSLLK